MGNSNGEVGLYSDLDEHERLALAIAGSGTGIWDRNVVTGEIHYSSDWKAMLGYSDSEVGSHITQSYSRVHPDDLEYVKAAMQAHFENRTPTYEVVHRLKHKKGHYVWVSSRGKVVSRDCQGAALRMVGTTTDITAIRAMSEKLHETAALITNLTNEVPGLVFQYRLQADGTSFFSYASAGIKEIYELDAEQVASSAAILDEIIHPDDIYAYHASLLESAVSLTPWHLEYRVRLPVAGLRWRQGDARPQQLADGATVWHGFITDITRRKKTEAELHELATTDFLTQLPNRRCFMAQMDAELMRIRGETDKPAAILMCDLDYFKAINDAWGHAAGDKALRHFADILRNHLRKSDMAARVGGEEFAIMLRRTDYSEAVSFARRLQKILAQKPLVEEDLRIDMTVSIGIAVMTADDVSSELSVSRSDTALYRAKKRGRNRIECD